MYSKIFALALALPGVFFVSIAAAQTTGLDLVRANTCLGCHQAEQQGGAFSRKVGPAFPVIAKRFAGQDGATDYLAHAIRSGGKGRWGAVAMPAQSQVTPEDAREIALWILSLNKGDPQ